MEDYKPNSHLSKSETNNDVPAAEKKAEKIVQGEVKTKKKNWFQKAAGEFIQEDAANIKDYILWDVLIPAAKSMIDDSVHMMLYGQAAGKKSNSTASKISYRSYYDDRRDYRKPERTRQTGYDYDDVILGNRGEAEEVLSRMEEILDRYQVVSVADFYDLVGIQGRYTDNKYGWTDLRNAQVIRVRDGYIIKLPRAMGID